MSINVQKNENGLAIFIESQLRSTNSTRKQNLEAGQQSEKSIFAGNLNVITDGIEQKRKQARSLAMKVIGDAFSDEKELDTSIKEQKQRVAELKDEYLQVAQQLKDVKAAKEMYIEEYGLNKEGAEATPEQQVELLEFEKAKTELSRSMLSMKEESKARNMAVENIMVERLKSHPMVDATEEANEIMEQAGKEIMGMLREETKEHIDETMEENKKKAEAAQEKKEEQEKLEEKNETPEEQKISHTAETMGELQEISQNHNMLQKELKIMVDTNQILEEDLKGLLLDQEL